MLFPAKAFLSTLLPVISTTAKLWNRSVQLAPGHFALEASNPAIIGYQYASPEMIIYRDLQQFDRRQNPRLGHFNPSALYSGDQVFAIQVVACTLAGVSLVSALLTLYWFLTMKKQFRHQLIMILTVADIVRSTWLFVFPVVTFAKGIVPSHSNFCQVSGLFLQTGYVMADYSVLFIAIHTALQVFKPVPLGLGEGGLYRYRYAVYGCVAVAPASVSSLAFIQRTSSAYKSQGPTCSLPLRPLWYRLTLSWVPRYLIMLTILGLYVAIYIHVGNEFGSYGMLRRRSHMESVDINSVEQGVMEDQPQSPCTQWNTTASPITSEVFAVADSGHFKPRLEATSIPVDACDGFSDRMAAEHPNTTMDNPKNAPAVNSGRAVHLRQKPDGIGKKILTEEMRSKRNAIRRQLRFLFIYPLLYFVLWLPFFVQQLMNYSSYWVQHPVFALGVLAWACIASMGAVDSLVFNLREKPWRHIPGSDGTFLGSFLFWQHGTNRKPE